MPEDRPHPDPLDTDAADFGALYDELPLWSAPFGQLLLERAPLDRNQTILDVGAGTGFLTVELAQRSGAGSRVIAVDPWPAATARLRWKVARLGLENVAVLERDAADTGLEDASVDLVVSNLGLNNFEHAEAVLGELARVARPGARIVVTSNVEGHMAELYATFARTLERLGQADRLAALDAHVRARGSADALVTQLAEHGFDRVESVDHSEFHLRYADGRALMRHWFIRLGFLDGWRKLPAPHRVEETLAALESDLDAVAARDGELVLTIPAVCIRTVRSAT